MKKLLIILTFLISSAFFTSDVNAEDYKSFDYTFTSSVGYTNDLVTEITNSGATIQDEALYLNGSSYIKYNFAKFEYDIANLTIEFDFKKIGSDSYPRLLYLGGINREIEVKGASKNMYISGEVTTTWAQNEWNHLKIVYNSETIEYYVNDVSVKTENYTGDITFLQFGQGSATNNRFTGYIDNLSLKVTLDDTAYFLKTDRSKIIYDKDANILKTYYDNVLTGSVDLNEYPYVIVEHFAVGQLFYSKYPFIYSSVHASENDFGGFLPTGDYYKFQINQSPSLYTYSADNVQNLYPIFQTEYLNASYDVTDIDTNTIYVKKMSIFDSFLPTITIAKESEETTTVNDIEYITAVNLKIETNITDNQQYICMFSADGRVSWDKYSCSESYTYRATDNQVYYAQIVDRETEQTINATTYEITKIQSIPSSNKKVDITIKPITNSNSNADYVSGGSCTVTRNGTTYKICQDLQISFSTLNGNLYLYQYSYDRINWYDFEINLIDKADSSNSYELRMYQNAILYVRVINLDNNQVNNSATYQVTTIESSSLSQSVTFTAVYYKDLMTIDVYATFLNYDPENYNYFFNTSADLNTFVNITDDISCSTNGGCKYKYTFDYSGIAYILIEDKNGNYVSAFTYEVNYSNYLSKKDTTDYMSDVTTFISQIKGYMTSFSNLISYFFSSLNATIKYAIMALFIVLVACCIIKIGRR